MSTVEYLSWSLQPKISDTAFCTSFGNILVILGVTMFEVAAEDNFPDVK